MIKLLHVMTVPTTLRFLRGQIGYMKERGFEVHVASSPGDELEAFGRELDVPIHGVPMPRRISPISDLGATARLVRVVRAIRPDILHTHTPKGGLLGMLAGRVTAVPIRFYHMRGLPVSTASGWRRLLLRGTEKISCYCAHRVIAVSPSLRCEALRLGLCPPKKIHVVGGGSSNGVDAVGLFNPDRQVESLRERTRATCSLPPAAPVVGFVGRLALDKGIRELLTAFADLRKRLPEAHLALVGSQDVRDPLPDTLLQEIDHVHFLGWRDDLPDLYSAFDVLALPSYREGFPNVALEAAAMRLPVVTTDAVGCRDAVLDGETGRVVPVGDIAALTSALEDYLTDPTLARDHGARGREWVSKEFRGSRIWEGIHRAYRNELLARGR